MRDRRHYKIASKKPVKKRPKATPRKIQGALIEMGHGKFTTRINPLNRHSKVGFALRRANKSTRYNHIDFNGQCMPTFLTN